MVKHVFLLFLTWLASVCAHDVHKHMTLGELRSTFHVDHHDLVPEYDVVHIHHVKRRSIGTNRDNVLGNLADVDSKYTRTKKEQGKTTETLKFKDDTANLRLVAFGKPLDLSLTRNHGLFKKGGLKIWTVEPNATAQHGVEYVEIPEGSEDVGEVYQDEQNEAAVLLRKDDKNGAVLVEGSIGSDLVIRPLPSRLRSKTRPTKEAEQTTPVVVDDMQTSDSTDDDEMFLDDDGELNSEVAIDTGLPIRRKPKPQGHQHIIYKRKNDQDDTLSDYAFMEPDHLAKRYRRSAQNLTSSHPRNKREAPYIIYPEILVIVDYDGYRLHGGDNLQIKRYFISFWNGVDMRYKLLKGPRVRISIAGIIISRGRDATPYLERNRVGRDAIDSAAALTDMGKYLFRERRLPVYDIAVAITKLDMCRRQYPSDVCNRGTAGFAYVGGACVVNKRLEKVNSVAIIEDTGGFSGIIVAAHEVGHLLGAVHDGSPPPSYLGGPGAEKCQWTDGYIMSDLRHTERGFRWSPCSISSFHHFLNGDTATCLFNAPHEDDSLPRVLPGKLLSLDAQCRRDRGTSACFKDDRVCAQLFCFDAGSGYCVAYRPAAEGSICGDGQYCVNGRCAAEHENIIPDYSQNTPSYIRREGANANQGRPLFHEDEDDNLVPEPPDSAFPQYTTQNPNQQNHYQNQYQNENPNVPNNDPYSTTQNPYYSTQTVSTHQPFNYFSISTTKSPYNFQGFGQGTTKPPYFQQFNTQDLHTTKNQYYTTKNYFYSTPNPFSNNYYSTTAPPVIQFQTTKNPYIGDYYILRQQTTKNPYDFANFGKNYQTTKNPYNTNYQDINNNYLKRSYNLASYYDSSNIRNITTNFNSPRITG